jgi:hypothetical protein
MTIAGKETEAPNESNARSKTPVDLIRLRVLVAADARPGRYPFRLVTPSGVSNALMFHVTEHSVAAEPEGAHETPESAVAVSQVPAVFTGRIGRRGESDFYAVEIREPRTLTFEVISGLPSLGAPGGNASGFDPSITIYEPSGSWFDAKRVNRIGFNDEPLWVLGQITDAHLTHRFVKRGRYLVRIEAFSGQGGPDYSYQFTITPGANPVDRAVAAGGWEERSFARTISSDRLKQISERGGKLPSQSIETYRGGQEPVPVRLPALVEGGIAQPGEAHRARFQIDGPQDIALEVATPAAAPPVFNPIVRLLNEGGDEVATNVVAGRGACTGALSKSLAGKTIVPLREPGSYTVEIRETTADFGDPSFRYQVLIRPQISHVGQVRIDEDHINLAAGAARTVRVLFDREEDYRGAIAIGVEALPAGVQAMTGADFEPDKDPPRYAGRRERYTPRSERAVVVLTAAPDAPAMTEPQLVRLVARPVVDGKAGGVIATKEIPMMVVAKR